MGYETLWNASAVREAAPSSHGLDKEGNEFSVCGNEDESVFEFCGALVSSLPEERTERAASQTHAWETRTIVKSAAAEVCSAVGTGIAGARIFHGTLDIETDGATNRKEIRRELSPRTRGMADEPPGLELAKTGAASFAKGPGRDRTMEAPDMAAYKKKPKSLEPISPSSMKAVSCSFPTSAKPGPRWDKLRCCGTVTGGIKSLRSPASRCRPAASDWVCTCACTPTTLLTGKFCRTFKFSCAICGDPLFSCGMAARSTGMSWSKRSFSGSTGCMSIDSPDMLRNSTLMNSYGRRPKKICPTVVQRMWTSLDIC